VSDRGCLLRRERLGAQIAHIRLEFGAKLGETIPPSGKRQNSRFECAAKRVYATQIDYVRLKRGEVADLVLKRSVRTSGRVFEERSQPACPLKLPW